MIHRIRPDLLGAYLDGELRGGKSRRLKAHLAS
jgi:anti-sigma factor RsiW